MPIYGRIPKGLHNCMVCKTLDLLTTIRLDHGKLELCHICHMNLGEYYKIRFK